jgi:hypothetical protein
MCIHNCEADCLDVIVEVTIRQVITCSAAPDVIYRICVVFGGVRTRCGLETLDVVVLGFEWRVWLCSITMHDRKFWIVSDRSW